LTAHTSGLWDFVEDWLPAAPARVLEVGCGDGSLTRQLLAAGFEATGIDPHAPSDDGFQRITVEAFRAPEPFDAVVAVRSLHHVADLERAVASMHSLLRPGGRLVLVEFAVEHLDEAARRWLTQHGLGGELDYDYSGVIPLGELERALGARFELLLREPGPHMAPELGREDLVQAERDAIAQGTLRPAGMRLVYERG
jgi:SAM-dependent methyltransferase